MPPGDSLQVVANFGVGYDNIDLDAARRRNVRVTNTPGVLNAATAELAVTLMLAAARRVAEGDDIVRAGKWDATAIRHVPRPHRWAARPSVWSASVGSVRRVAHLLRGSTFAVVYVDVADVRDGCAGPASWISTTCSRADFVSLHVALTPESATHLIDARRLAQMKPGSILVNASRGAVVDTAALIDALREGRTGGGGARRLRGRARCAGGAA